jgi:N-acetyl-1-D-myo-inositol-2-amino-2-deoxy-alpha-D-glucopyranoside deacetylase
MSEGRVLMAVVPHPDDESFVAGGTLALYAEAGVRTVLVVCTGGEVGEISDPTLATVETLAEVRARELAASAEALGVARVVELGYRDSGMAGTPANQDPRAFLRANADEAIGRLVAIVRAERPQVLVCPNERGDYGHPDHVQANRIATAAFAVAGDPTRYPTAGRAWAPAKLYYSAFARSAMERFTAALREAGIEDPFANFQPVDMEGRPVDLVTADELVTTEVEIGRYVERKRASFLAHRTQFGADDVMMGLSPEMFGRIFMHEQFRLAAGQMGSPAGQRESDLFAGL